MADTTDLLAAKARARQAEAAAARREAEGYLLVARACRERAEALREAAHSDEALAREAPNGAIASFARSDAGRATKQAELYEAQALRYDKSARRAFAEAERAETEAGTARAKAERVAATVQ